MSVRGKVISPTSQHFFASLCLLFVNLTSVKVIDRLTALTYMKTANVEDLRLSIGMPMAWLRSKRAQNAGRLAMLRVHLVSRMPANDTGCEFANVYREAHADNAEVPISKRNQSIVLAAKLREAPYRFSAQGGNGTKVPVEQGFLNCSSAKLNHNEDTITSPQ